MPKRTTNDSFLIYRTDPDPDGDTEMIKLNHYTFYISDLRRVSCCHDGWDDQYMKAPASVDKWYLEKCSNAERALKAYGYWVVGGRR